MKLLYFSALLFVFVSFGHAQSIKSGSLQAYSDGSTVTVRWITEDEAAIAGFDVQRRSEGDPDFVTIKHFDPKGPSLYEFVDYSAFRKTTTLYQYRIAVKATNGMVEFAGPLTVSHTVSGVRRTWGSIKSMFR